MSFRQKKLSREEKYQDELHVMNNKTGLTENESQALSVLCGWVVEYEMSAPSIEPETLVVT